MSANEARRIVVGRRYRARRLDKFMALGPRPGVPARLFLPPFSPAQEAKVFVGLMPEKDAFFLA